MLKIAMIHISGPKMDGMQRQMLEMREGGLEGYRDKLAKRTEEELAELNTLISEGYEKFDSQIADFADGQAIVYVLRKADSPGFVIEHGSMEDELGARDWKRLPETYADYQSAWNACQRMRMENDDTFAQYQIVEVGK